MSQSSIILPEAGPLSMAAFVTTYLNPALAALLTNNSGTVAPASPSQWQLWVNTTASPPQLEIFDGANWLVICSMDPVAHSLGVAASALLGTTLPANVLNSSLTGLGLIGNLKVSAVSLPTNLLMSSTAPSVASGFGGGSVTANNGTAAFRIAMGGAAATGVITMPTAANGWKCDAQDITTQSATVFSTKQTGSSANSITLGNFNDVGASANWGASDVLLCSAVAF